MLSIRLNSLKIALAFLIAVSFFNDANAQKERLLELPVADGHILTPDPFLSVNEKAIIFVKPGLDTMVRCCKKGVVVYKKKLSRGLWTVTVKSGDTLLHYSKLRKVEVQVHQKVDCGEILGCIGGDDALQLQATMGVLEIDPKMFVKFKMLTQKN